MRDDFAIFILSNNRANQVTTIDSLNKSNYSGKWYLILDDEDLSIDEYRKIYGESHIIVFNKSDAHSRTDTFESSGRKNAVVFARNECFRIANSLGLTYFLELDDDYVRFEYRYEKDNKLMTALIENFDEVVDEVLEFLDTTDAVSIAFSQGGDFIGGVESRNFKQKILRKAMNSFFCRADRQFDFVGLINEDVNTYVTLGSRGRLFLTYSPLSLVQCATQHNKGGLTDIYLALGTYQKSFYSVVCAPSCVQIRMMGEQHQRLHHVVDWERCCPKIVSDRFKHI